MSRLHTLVYVSSATERLSESALELLLATSRANNERDGLTGVLLYGDGNFMQLLEGDETKLRALMRKIEADARHTGVIVLLDEAVARRSFPEWQMGCMHAAKSELLALSTERWHEMDTAAGDAPGLSRGLVALHSFARRKHGRG